MAEQIYRLTTSGHGGIWARLVRSPSIPPYKMDLPADELFKLGQRSAYPAGCGGEEDHEAILYSGPLQAHVSRIEAVEASSS